MTLSERKFIFHARAVIYNGQQASMFALFYFVFCCCCCCFFSSREGFQSVEKSSQRNKKLIGKKLNNAFLFPLKPLM